MGWMEAVRAVDKGQLVLSYPLYRTDGMIQWVGSQNGEQKHAEKKPI